jgi:hypothetical protein
MTLNTIIIFVLLSIIGLAMTHTIEYEGYVNNVTMSSIDTTSSPSEKDAVQFEFRDVQYHEDPDTLKEDITIKVKNRWGKLVDMPWSTAVTTTPFYNTPDSFRFGPNNYVPDYEESILLSRGMRSR